MYKYDNCKLRNGYSFINHFKLGATKIREC